MKNVTELAAAGIKRSFLVGCLAVVIGVPLIGAFFYVVLGVVVPAIEASGAERQPWMMTGVFVVTIGGMLALAFGSIVGVGAYRAHKLDAIFSPLGLKGSPYMLSGRQYLGRYLDWDLEVSIYRGPTVDLRFSVPVQTRLQVVLKDSIPAAGARLFDKTPLPIGDPLLDPLAIFAADETWVRALLSVPQVGQALLLLMERGANWAVFRSVEVQPGELIFHLYRSRNGGFGYDLGAADVRVWLEQMQIIAAALKTIPAPQAIAALSGSPPPSRQRMNRILTWAVVASLIALLACVIITIFAAFTLAS